MKRAQTKWTGPKKTTTLQYSPPSPCWKSCTPHTENTSRTTLQYDTNGPRQLRAVEKLKIWTVLVKKSSTSWTEGAKKKDFMILGFANFNQVATGCRPKFRWFPVDIRPIFRPDVKRTPKKKGYRFGSRIGVCYSRSRWSCRAYAPV